MPDRASPLDAVPAPALVLLAITAIQLGAGLATYLFPILGAEGTVAIRIIISALLLLFVARGRLAVLARIFGENKLLLGGLGVCVAAMNLLFYLALVLLR